jgi:branched-subunit amino acid transport protein
MTAPLDWSWGLLLVLVGLGLITLLTRGFFLFPEREWPLPPWLRQGLRYAPLAAVAAVVAPEVVMSQGQVITTLRDARLYGAAVALLFFAWRRNILGTMLAGMAVFLPLRLILGW